MKWTTFALIIIATVAVVWYACWLMLQPLRFRKVSVQKLAEYLDDLFYRGREGATLVIEVRRKPALIVRKRVVAVDEVRLYCKILGVPTVGDSGEGILREIKNAGLGHGIERFWQSSEAVQLQFGNDRKIAARIINELLRRSYTIDGVHEAIVYLTRIQPGNVRVGFSH